VGHAGDLRHLGQRALAESLRAEDLERGIEDLLATRRGGRVGDADATTAATGPRRARRLLFRRNRKSLLGAWVSSASSWLSR
jgi:hypothetical protein